jgi:hypothetical protein
LSWVPSSRTLALLWGNSSRKFPTRDTRSFVARDDGVLLFIHLIVANFLT